MRNWMLFGMVALVCYGGESVKSDYSVLVISSEVISVDGQIDSRRWEKWEFQHPAHLSVGKGIERKEYLPIGDLYFPLYGPVENLNAVKEGLSRRFEKVSAKKHIAIVKGHVHYQGRKLKYPGKVIEGPAKWGSTISGDDPHGFRFQNYLIFMVQVRPFSEENCFDFVLYNLKDDTYAIHRTFGGWPLVWMFRRDEAVSDPRPKAENS